MTNICTKVTVRKRPIKNGQVSLYLDKYIEGDGITNSSLRERFGLKPTSSASISRLIKEALEKKLIKPIDSETGQRYMKYIPIWG